MLGPRGGAGGERTAAANIAMHPVTGAFVDPSHETACAAQFFRMAFPCHAFLMALALAFQIWTSTLSAPPDMWPRESIAAFCMTLGLIGRVLVHRMHDTARGQRLGSWIWTALLVLVVAISVIGYVELVAQACGGRPVTLQAVNRTIQAVSFTLLNGSHGLGLWHKLGLMALMLLDGLCAITFCGEVALAGESMIVVGFVVAHLAEMRLRRSYVERVEKEQLLKEDLPMEPPDIDSTWGESALPTSKRIGVPGGVQLKLGDIFWWLNWIWVYVFTKEILLHYVMYVFEVYVGLYVGMGRMYDVGPEAEYTMHDVAKFDSQIMSSLTYIVTFSLGTYLSTILGRYHERFNNCCQTNGNMTLISLISGAELKDNVQEASTMLRWSNLMMHMYYMMVEGKL